MLRSTTHLVGWTLPSAQHCERWGWTTQGLPLCIDAWRLPRPHVTQLGAAVPGHLYSVKHGRTLGGRSCADVMVRSEPERARSSVRWSRRRGHLRRYSRPPFCRPRAGYWISAFRWRRQEIRIAREKPRRIGLLSKDGKSVPGAHQWSAAGIGDDRYVQEGPAVRQVAFDL